MVSDGGPGAAATIASPSFATTITFFIRSLWLCVFLVHPFAHFSATRSPRPGTGRRKLADCRRRGCSPNRGEGVKPFPRGLGPRRPRMPRPDTRHRVFLRRPQGISPFPVPCGPTQRTVPCVCSCGPAQRVPAFFAPPAGAFLRFPFPTARHREPSPVFVVCLSCVCRVCRVFVGNGCNPRAFDL